MLLPSSSETSFVSGSTPTAACRIQDTPLGMTDFSGLALLSTGAHPPPTRVHNGW